MESYEKLKSILNLLREGAKSFFFRCRNNNKKSKKLSRIIECSTLNTHVMYLKLDCNYNSLTNLISFHCEK